VQGMFASKLEENTFLKYIVLPFARQFFEEVSSAHLSQFFFHAKQGAEENSDQSERNIRGNAKLNSTVKNCVAQFKRGNISTRDAPRAISRERVGSIIHEHLGMWKLSAKWVPKCLKAYQ